MGNALIVSIQLLQIVIRIYQASLFLQYLCIIINCPISKHTTERRYRLLKHRICLKSHGPKLVLLYGYIHRLLLLLFVLHFH